MPLPIQACEGEAELVLCHRFAELHRQGFETETNPNSPDGPNQASQSAECHNFCPENTARHTLNFVNPLPPQNNVTRAVTKPPLRS